MNSTTDPLRMVDTAIAEIAQVSAMAEAIGAASAGARMGADGLSDESVVELCWAIEQRLEGARAAVHLLWASIRDNNAAGANSGEQGLSLDGYRVGSNHGPS